MLVTLAFCLHFVLYRDPLTCEKSFKKEKITMAYKKYKIWERLLIFLSIAPINKNKQKIQIQICVVTYCLAKPLCWISLFKVRYKAYSNLSLIQFPRLFCFYPCHTQISLSLSLWLSFCLCLSLFLCLLFTCLSAHLSVGLSTSLCHYVRVRNFLFESDPFC